jgi:hypothetical protein
MITENALQLDMRYRGHRINIAAEETSIGWNWTAVVDEMYPLEGEDGVMDSAEAALAKGKVMVKNIIDADTDSRF